MRIPHVLRVYITHILVFDKNTAHIARQFLRKRLTNLLYPAFAEVARMMSTIAKLQINNVPQAEGYEWSVRKVTHKTEHGVMHGVKWTLPKKMFIELGDRLTGSIAVSFIPSQVQQVGVVLDEKPTFGQGTVLARAEVHMQNRNQPIYTPPAQQHHPKPFIELHIAPSLNAG